MATAEEYARWIVENQDKRGTPDFDTVAAAYKRIRTGEQAAATEMAGQEKINAAQRPANPNTLADDVPGRMLYGMKQGINAGAQLLPRGLQAITSGFGLAPNRVSNFLGEEAKRVDAMNAAEKQSYDATRRSNSLRATGDEPGADWPRIAGEVASPTNKAALVTTPLRAAAPAASLARRGAVLGAEAGALTPVDMSQPGTDFGTEKAKQVVLGGATGAAATPVLSKVTQAVTPRNIPTSAELKAMANDAYTRSENAGVVLNPQSYTTLLGNMQAATPLVPKLHDGTIGALEYLEKQAGRQLSLKQIDELRQILRDAASKGPADAAKSRILTGVLDRHVKNLTNADLMQGDIRIAGPALLEGRDMYFRTKKAEMIEDIVAKANLKDFGSRTAAMRAGFRALAADADDMRVFSPDEQEAIRGVASGTLQNVLGVLNKLSPVKIGGLSTLVASGAHPAAMAANAVGLGAGAARAYVTASGANAAGQTVRGRGAPLLSPTMRALVDQVAMGAAAQSTMPQNQQTLAHTKLARALGVPQ